MTVQLGSGGRGTVPRDLFERSAERFWQLKICRPVHDGSTEQLEHRYKVSNACSNFNDPATPVGLVLCEVAAHR